MNAKVDSFFPVAVVIALALGGCYRVTHRRLQPSAFLEMRELSFGVGCGCVLTLAVGSFLHATSATVEPNPTQLVMAVLVTIVVITLGRMILRYFLHTLTTTRVLVVGAGTTAERIMLSVRQDPGMNLVGRVVDGDLSDPGSLGRVGDLPDLCRTLDVHRILVTARDEFSTESLDVYRDLQEHIHIAMVPRYYELISWRSRLTDLAGMPFLEIAQPHLSRWDTFMKRAFDLAFSSAVLLVTSPLLLVVAVGVKLSSPGTGVLPPDPSRPPRAAVHGDQVPHHDRRDRGGTGRRGGTCRWTTRPAAARVAEEEGRVVPHHPLRGLPAQDRY